MCNYLTGGGEGAVGWDGGVAADDGGLGAEGAVAAGGVNVEAMAAHFDNDLRRMKLLGS